MDRSLPDALILQDDESDDLFDFTVVKQGGLRKFRCNKCGKIISSFKLIKRHIRYAHLQGDYICRCGTCQKEFKTLPQLKTHMRSHKEYNCPECSLPFTKADMIYHRADVHGIPVPICDICGLRFQDKYAIAKHYKTVHSKEKKFQCQECGMKFVDLIHLNLHMVRHNPVLQYECRYCSKAFSRQRVLNDHEKLHTGQDKCVCHVCGKVFANLAYMKKHTLKHHPDAF